MNLYDKSSLILVPGAVKDGKVYSQRPENGDGDFTFSRSTAATRVNADGLIEKEMQNLLKYSGDLTQSQWQNIRTTDVSGQAGYDGTNNAFKIIPSTDNNTHRLDYVDTWSTGQVYTFSFYAKESGYDTIDIVIGGTSIGGDYGRFNLSTGTATNSNAIAASMEDLGSGWYRCQVAQISGSTTRINIGINDGTTQSYAGDGTSGVLIQHPQLEEGLVARDYIETTTAAVYGGITDNIPRLDYTDASCPSLLLEPQRTNLVTQSEYYNTYYTLGSLITITDNYAISPEGVQNASRWVSSVGAYPQMSRLISGLTIGQDYTASFYVKSDGTSQILQSTWFTGFSSTTFTPTDEWQRISFSITATATSHTFLIFTNSGSAPASSFLLYGIQIEESSYATSYIPTYGASVTRVKDFCYGAGNDQVINSEEGVLYFEGSALANDGTNRYLSIDDGTISNYIYFRYVSTSNNVLFRTAVAGVTINTLATSLPDTTQNHKFAFKWKSGDYAFWIDGVEVGTDTSSTIFSPNVLSNIEFSFPTENGGGFPSNTRQIMVFNTALTNEELADLTTI